MSFERAGVRWEALAAFATILERLHRNCGEEIQRTPAKLVERYTVEERTLYVKRYLHGVSASRPLKYIFKHPRSWREWLLAHRLEVIGVPIVTHVAHGERWSWRGLEESILVTEGLPGYAALSNRADAGTPEVQR
ncbi:MAG TPA: lipopolysaccharide kinase InaA family protein, partial [Candidatus Binataceae bacterium]